MQLCGRNGDYMNSTLHISEHDRKIYQFSWFASSSIIIEANKHKIHVD